MSTKSQNNIPDYLIANLNEQYEKYLRAFQMEKLLKCSLLYMLTQHGCVSQPQQNLENLSLKCTWSVINYGLYFAYVQENQTFKVCAEIYNFSSTVLSFPIIFFFS